MYGAEIFTPEKENNVQTITTLEIADMMEIKHWQILRKLDGTKKVKGIIQILSNNKIVVADFFQESSYTDEQGKERPCYKVTKLGCDFLANKFTGEKGILFTAKYVKRFAELEQAFRQPTLQELPPNWYEMEEKPAKVPIFKSWYKRNKGRIYRLCKRGDTELSVLYHYLLTRIGERYDLDAANAIYEKEMGHAPAYAMDIVEYFPELGKEADKLLDRLENL